MLTRRAALSSVISRSGLPLELWYKIVEHAVVVDSALIEANKLRATYNSLVQPFRKNAALLREAEKCFLEQLKEVEVKGTSKDLFSLDRYPNILLPALHKIQICFNDRAVGLSGFVIDDFDILIADLLRECPRLTSLTVNTNHPKSGEFRRGLELVVDTLRDVNVENVYLVKTIAKVDWEGVVMDMDAHPAEAFIHNEYAIKTIIGRDRPGIATSSIVDAFDCVEHGRGVQFMDDAAIDAYFPKFNSN